MAKVIEPRNVSPIIKTLRTFLLGRDHTNALRFADGIAARTQPAPSLPDGPAHILAANYYYSRDGRREAAPPAILAEGTTKILIAESKPAVDDKLTTADVKKTLPTPGKVWQWD